MTTKIASEVDERVLARRERWRAWYKANPDKANAQRKRSLAKALAWRDANPDKVRAYRKNAIPKIKEWVAANPDKIRAYQKKYHDNNLEELRRKARERYHANKAADPEYSAKCGRRFRERNPNWEAEWNKAHPGNAAERSAKSRHNRRVQRAACSDGSYTVAELRALRARVGHKCALCGEKGRMTIDHIKPLAKGGSNSIRNIQFLCRSCNSKKHAKDPIRFSRELGLLL